ncbi:homeobox protein vex1-like [Rhinatrema bivittatum]|uniref:homeobox protein vex1-like n=1 Tax=Rhinatrema bivittatum TaxID=194408 RepID=UPI0011269DA1|nr:homeobox protein vex1-like [Rhinatrema bivittatum]
MEKGVFSVQWLAQSSQKRPESTSLGLANWKPGPCLQTEEGFNELLTSRPRAPQNDSDIWHKGTSALKSLPSECKEGLDGASLRTLRPDAQDCGRVPEKPSLEEQDSSRQAGIRASASQQLLPEDEANARPRTKFSAKQLQELERSFQEHRYIGASEKRRLAKVLKLSEIQIKTWFQNRRMKFKRQSQDARVEAFFSGLLHPQCGYPELQAPGCATQSAFPAPYCSLPTPTIGIPMLTPPPFLGIPGPALQPALLPLQGLCPFPSPTSLPLVRELTSPKFYPYPTSS